MIIDIHAHYIPQLVFDRFEREASKFPGVALTRDDKGVRIGFVGKDLSRPIMPKLSALADRRAWMDANGIDHQLPCRCRAASSRRRCWKRRWARVSAA